jgi:branched-subunit amino acid aminotransferase/4-amino-4-deoxychorismate lyase/phosphoglycolate phosphatase-like HAD superfamily hydrolase
MDEKLLLLFDVDGTLLNDATGPVRDAIRVALQRHHGVDSTRMKRPLSTAGRTDGEIVRAILLDAGVSAARIDELADAVRETCCELCAELYPGDLSDRVIDGVGELLTWLAGRDDAVVGLLTGNFECVAKLKLERAGIGWAFASGAGAFGSDAEDRAALPAIARRRAGSGGVPHPRCRTIVIGDTPHDVACARADGVRCVAVATGEHAPAELVGADRVVHDPIELRRALAELLDRPDPAKGVFETIAVADGAIQALDEHLERIDRSVTDLYDLRLPADTATRARTAAGTLDGRYRMRIQAIPGADDLTVRISTEPYARPDPDRVYTLTPITLPGGLGPHKWSDRRLLDRLSSEASVPLLVDADGDVLEAAWANVWILEGDRIVTPPTDGRILPGVTRALLLAHAGAVGLTAATEPIPLERARRADAVFLTSSLRLAARATLDGRAAGPAGAGTIGAIRTALQAVGWDPAPARR